MAATTRAGLDAQLERWRSGALDAASLKRWVERAPPGEDEAAREALAELDLLEVHLLTVEDVAALPRGDRPRRALEAAQARPALPAVLPLITSRRTACRAAGRGRRRARGRSAAGSAPPAPA